MTPADEAALLRELTDLRDRCQATMSAIGQVQLQLARRAADRAEVRRLDALEFGGPQVRTTLDP